MGFDALINEALLFTIGGSHTTAYTLSYAVYHVLRAPEILSRLRNELEGASAAINKEFDWHQIKNLPYLVRQLHHSPCYRDYSYEIILHS